MSKVLFLLQEIPATFAAETGWPHVDECCLVTSIDFAKEWPLRLRRSADARMGIAVVLVGRGWAQFVSEHSLGDGAFLTFEMVDERTLVVAVHSVGTPCSYDHPEQERIPEETYWHLCSANWPPLGCSCETPRSLEDVVTEVASDPRQTQFIKTLRKTHLKKNDGGRLASTDPNSLRIVNTLFGIIETLLRGRHAASWLWRSSPETLSCGNSCGGRRMCRHSIGALTERRRSMAKATL
jgi:hypothetical protein